MPVKHSILNIPVDCIKREFMRRREEDHLIYHTWRLAARKDSLLYSEGNTIKQDVIETVLNAV